MSTTTIKPPPVRSPDQRMEALNKANDVRSRRSQLKRDLKAGHQSAARLLADPPEYIETMKIMDVLLAVPKFGRTKATKAINRARVSPTKTVGGLNDRQRRELARELDSGRVR